MEAVVPGQRSAWAENPKADENASASITVEARAQVVIMSYSVEK
jgi:hypothetical protein